MTNSKSLEIEKIMDNNGFDNNEDEVLKELLLKVKKNDNEAFIEFKRLLKKRSEIAKQKKRYLLYELNPEETDAEIDYLTYKFAIDFNVSNNNIGSSYSKYLENGILNEYRKKTGCRRKFRLIPETKLTENMCYLSNIVDDSKKINSKNYSPEQQYIDSIYVYETTKKTLQELNEPSIIRHVLYLRYGEQKTIKEIGNELKIDYRKVSKVLSRFSPLILEKLNLNKDSKIYEEPPDDLTFCRLAIKKALKEWTDEFSIKIEKEYEEYISGKRRTNPIKEITPDTIPILKKCIYEIHLSKFRAPYKKFEEMGFGKILKNKSLTDIVSVVAPEIIHKIPKVQKWKRHDSIDIALKAIEKKLYEIEGFEQAQKLADLGNKDPLIEIMINFLESTKNLYKFFKDLSPLMTSFIDKIGENGISKTKSPKALLEFYDKKRGYGLFDITKEKHIPKYLLRERGMWRKGDESVNIARDMIKFNLRRLSPDFKTAEEKKDTLEELIALDIDIIRNTKNLRKFNKITGTLKNLIDKEGIKGIRVANSFYEILRFYNQSDNLSWFNKNFCAYISKGERKRSNTRVIYTTIESSKKALKTYLEKNIKGLKEADESKDIYLIASILDKNLLKNKEIKEKIKKGLRIFPKTLYRFKTLSIYETLKYCYFDSYPNLFNSLNDVYIQGSNRTSTKVIYKK
ncbi:MAG: hypothetical protein QXW97_01680 [Candidatus Pacearchaeota archaeon]